MVTPRPRVWSTAMPLSKFLSLVVITKMCVMVVAALPRKEILICHIVLISITPTIYHRSRLKAGKIKINKMIFNKSYPRTKKGAIFQQKMEENPPTLVIQYFKPAQIHVVFQRNKP